MKSITRIAAALVALLTLWSHAAAQLPLNTGYNYQTFSQYPVNVQDNYWINIASSTGTPAGPSRVITPHPAWFQGPFPAQGGAWINAWNSYNSPPQVPAWTLYRKCFCLLPGFKNASLKFETRADDNMGVWFNSVLNQVLPFTQGHFANSQQPLVAGTQTGFRVGKNCVYALVEDFYGVATGFYLKGSVTADGLLPTAAAGTGQSFAPCSCQSGHPGAVDAADPRGAALDRRAQALVEEEERKVVDEIIKVAKARSLERRRERR